jgi:hypothetical protein
MSLLSEYFDGIVLQKYFSAITSGVLFRLK